MKNRINKIYLLLVLSLPFMLGSCSGDPEPDSEIALVSGPNLTTSSRTVSSGTDLAAKITARALSEGNTLTRFRVLLTYHPVPAEELVYLDSALNSTTFNYIFRFQTRRIPGSENYRFEITDSNGKVKSAGFRLTISGNTAAEHYSYAVKLLHPTDTLSRSFLSATAGAVYDKTPVAGETFQKLVDMVYFFRNGDSATLAAPADGAVGKIKPVDITRWQSRNKTEFKSVSASIFNNANTRPLVVNAFSGSNSAPVTSIQNLQKDTYFAFRTAAGKQGILKINDIRNDSTENSVALDVKVEK